MNNYNIIQNDMERTNARGLVSVQLITVYITFTRIAGWDIVTLLTTRTGCLSTLVDICETQNSYCSCTLKTFKQV